MIVALIVENGDIAVDAESFFTRQRGSVRRHWKRLFAYPGHLVDTAREGTQVSKS